MFETEENKTKNKSRVKKIFIIAVLLVMVIPGLRNYAKQIFDAKSDAALILIMPLMGALILAASDVVTKIQLSVGYKPDWQSIRDGVLEVVIFFGIIYFGRIILFGYANSFSFWIGVLVLLVGLWPSNWRLPTFIKRDDYTLENRLYSVALAMIFFCAHFNLFSRLLP